MRRGWEANKDRVDSCWALVYEASQMNPKSVLIIGQKKDFIIESMQRVSIKTDVVAPAKDGSFSTEGGKKYDVVICAGILAHIPYKKFRTTLRRIYNVVNEGAIIQLPDAGPCFTVKKKVYSGLSLSPYTMEENHFWEIGTSRYGLLRVRYDIFMAGFALVNTYRVPDNPFHRLFILEKKG